jgi:hypothetical protein
MTLCESFWFWSVVLGGGAVIVLAAWFHGYFTGYKTGRHVTEITSDVRVRALLDKYGEEA